MQHLLLLHGAISSQAQMKPLASMLASHFTVHTFDFEGHGGQPILESPFRMAAFAQNTLDYMDANGIESAYIYGYSMGGYVGMYLARHAPERVKSVITTGTKYVWDEASSKQEVRFLNPDKILAKVPKFAAYLEKCHAPADWKQNLEKTAEMMLHMGKHASLTDEDLAAITQPVLLSSGDRDKTAYPAQTLATYQKLPNAQLWIIPNTPHPLAKAPLQAIVEMIKGFFG